MFRPNIGFRKKDMVVADIGLRDLGTVVPGKQLGEPNAVDVPAFPVASQVIQQDLVSRPQTIFGADRPDGTDALGVTAPLAVLAELAAHARTETPLTIGLFGPPGSGKSFALSRLLRAIELLTTRAAEIPDTPYVGEMVTIRVDATHLDGNPATALTGALHAGLAKAFPALAAEAARAARDPRTDASEALDRLDTCRSKLEAEKRSLDETNARRARLTETILYQTAGSQIDAFAGANKARIKALLARLGIAGDALPAFKEMAGALAGTHGYVRRAGFAMRAFLAFKRQRRLIANAMLLLIAGAALGFAIDAHTAWLSRLRANEFSIPIANWLEAHMDLLASLREIVFLGAAALLGVNVWRAFRWLKLVFRGAALLQADVAIRLSEMDRLFAHQVRRVKALAAEENALSRLAAEAERRAGTMHHVYPPLAEPSLFPETGIQQAQLFAAAVGAMITRPSQTGPGKASRGTPRRLVFAVDHLDEVSSSRGREILVHARSLFTEGYVVLVAADPARLIGAEGKTGPCLDRWIQVPFQIGEIASRANYSTFVHEILNGQDSQDLSVCNARTSALDRPMSSAETQLLADLAPLAGSSARAVKRFVNLYRLARAQNANHWGALAFMLALDAGGTQSEIAALNDALSNADGEADLALHQCQCGARLIEALAAVRLAHGRLSVAAAQRAAATTRIFSFRS